MSKLLVVNDGKRERELLLVETLVVGRDPACDFSHDDALLSRRHAEFTTTRDEVTVRDLGSRNGIFVNGTRAAERVLRPGDVVQIGPLRVRYVAERALVSLVADDLDIDATKVIPPIADGPFETLPAPPSTTSEDDFDEEEEETRVFPVPDGVSDRSISEADGETAETLFTAPPPRPPNSRIIPPTTLPSGRHTAPATAGPTSSTPFIPVASVDRSALTIFVFVQLAALTSVVFVASAVPLIMWGDETLGTTPAGGALGLVRWPGLPIVIALVATYVVAQLVNRRFLDALAITEGHSSRGAEHDPARHSTGRPRA